MKGILVAAVLAVGSVVALSGGEDTRASQSQDTPWEQGISRFDGVLQHGLSGDTHEGFAVKAKQGASWLEGVGADLKAATE